MQRSPGAQLLLVPKVDLYRCFDPDNGSTHLAHPRILSNLTHNELGGERKGTLLSGGDKDDDVISGTASHHQLLNNADHTFSIQMAVGSASQRNIQLVVDGFTVWGGASRSIAPDPYGRRSGDEARCGVVRLDHKCIQ